MLEQLSDWLYPELSEYSRDDRQRLLAKAREGSFDGIELTGLAIALVLTVLLTRYSITELTLAGRFAAVLINFIVAIPLLAVLGGPFLFRRTRRHLREALRDRRSKR